ncbi:unnamed protein product [Alopecurus aequalis]
MAGSGSKSAETDGERRIGVAMDYSASSKSALDWAIRNLIRRGDTVVVLYVLHPDGDGAKQAALWAKSGSPLIPLSEFREPAAMHSYGVRPDAEVLDMLDTAARQLELKVVAKLYWGDARDKLCGAVEEQRIDTLVMGSRGLGPIQRILLGSVTNYVLSHASCPVTVVKGSPAK